MTLAAEQSSLVRAAGVVVVVGITGLYLFIRELRGKKRRNL